MNTEKKYLDRREQAEYLTAKGLKTSPKTLGKLASVGGGPVYWIFGSRALSTPTELDRWAEAKLSAPRCSTTNTEQAAA